MVWETASPTPRTGPAAGDDTVDRSSVLVPIGPRGQLLASLHADEAGPAMADIARRLS